MFAPDHAGTAAELVVFEFVAAFRDLLTRFNPAEDDGAPIESEYYLITAEP
jgi:hypothetical protein